MLVIVDNYLDDVVIYQCLPLQVGRQKSLGGQVVDLSGNAVRVVENQFNGRLGEERFLAAGRPQVMLDVLGGFPSPPG